MTTEPSHESVTRHVRLADEALGDANYLLNDHRLNAAVNRTYYAMFHAVQAALIAAKARSPKTHSGAMNLFSRHYISTGRMAREFGKDLQDAYDLRQQSDYDIYTVVGEAQVREMIQKADAFVTAVKTLLGRS
jgi:uncharacterized protein